MGDRRIQRGGFENSILKGLLIETGTPHFIGKKRRLRELKDGDKRHNRCALRSVDQLSQERPRGPVDHFPVFLCANSSRLDARARCMRGLVPRLYANHLISSVRSLTSRSAEFCERCNLYRNGTKGTSRASYFENPWLYLQFFDSDLEKWVGGFEHN